MTGTLPLTEYRSVVELRTEGRRLTGYAARFNTQTRIGDFIETIKPGAFAESLASGRDVRGLIDHDSTKILARTKSGTLKLKEDPQGLIFDLSVPATSSGHDILELAQRSDLSGMSFGFLVPKDGEFWTGDHRELRSVTLIEISVITGGIPAYEGTTVNPRSKTPRLNLARLYLETCR